jgi:hypothetical protein
MEYEAASCLRSPIDDVNTTPGGWPILAASEQIMGVSVMKEVLALALRCSCTFCFR